MINIEEVLEFSGFPKLRYPNNIVDSDKSIFDCFLKIEIPNMEVKKLNNILVSPYGIMYKNFNLIKECTPFSFNFEPVSNNYHKHFVAKYINAGGRIFGGTIERFVRHFILFKKTKIIETCFWCSDQYSEYYMHWLCETLPRIYLLSLLKCENPKVILPGPTMRDIKFIRQSLALLFPDINFLFTENHNMIESRELIWISHMGQPFQFNPLLMTGFREFVRRKLKENCNSSGKKLYISRRNAVCRKIINENEVEQLLRGFGFETICFEDYSFEEQVKICSQSEILIGIHGAGLSNMIFQPEGSFVLELQRRMSYASCFYSLANALDLNYYYLFCKPDFEEVDGRLDNVNLHVDIGALTNLVENMVSTCEAKKNIEYARIKCDKNDITEQNFM